MRKIFILLFFCFFVGCQQQINIVDKVILIHTITKYQVEQSGKVCQKIYYKELDRQQNTILEINFYQNGEKVAKRTKIIGKDKIIETIEFYNSNNTLDSLNTQISYFNTNGKVEKTLLLDSKGDTSKIIQFLYDSNGILKKRIEFSANSELKQATEANYEYLPNGNISKIILSNNLEPGKKIIEEYIYLSENQSIRKVVQDETNTTREIINYKYNSFGLVVEEIHIFPSGVSEKFKYEYTFF